MGNYITGVHWLSCLVVTVETRQHNTIKHSAMKLNMCIKFERPSICNVLWTSATELLIHHFVHYFKHTQIPYLPEVPNHQASNEVSPESKCGVCVGVSGSGYVKCKIFACLLISYLCNHMTTLIFEMFFIIFRFVQKLQPLT